MVPTSPFALKRSTRGRAYITIYRLHTILHYIVYTIIYYIPPQHQSVLPNWLIIIYCLPKTRDVPQHHKTNERSSVKNKSDILFYVHVAPYCISPSIACDDEVARRQSSTSRPLGLAHHQLSSPRRLFYF